jgi:hypothetical protein
MDDATTGLEVGRHCFLHPGPLRWLRALGWMVLPSVVLGLLQAGGRRRPSLGFGYRF